MQGRSTGQTMEEGGVAVNLSAKGFVENNPTGRQQWLPLNKKPFRGDVNVWPERGPYANWKEETLASKAITDLLVSNVQEDRRGSTRPCKQSELQ